VAGFVGLRCGGSAAPMSFRGSFAAQQAGAVVRGRAKWGEGEQLGLGCSSNEAEARGVGGEHGGRSGSGDAADGSITVVSIAGGWGWL
jgi:hypothetical protein